MRKSIKLLAVLLIAVLLLSVFPLQGGLRASAAQKLTVGDTVHITLESTYGEDPPIEVLTFTPTDSGLYSLYSSSTPNYVGMRLYQNYQNNDDPCIGSSGTFYFSNHLKLDAFLEAGVAYTYVTWIDSYYNYDVEFDVTLEQIDLDDVTELSPEVPCTVAVKASETTWSSFRPDKTGVYQISSASGSTARDPLWFHISNQYGMSQMSGNLADDSYKLYLFMVAGQTYIIDMMVSGSGEETVDYTFTFSNVSRDIELDTATAFKPDIFNLTNKPDSTEISYCFVPPETGRYTITCTASDDPSEHIDSGTWIGVRNANGDWLNPVGRYEDNNIRTDKLIGGQAYYYSIRINNYKDDPLPINSDTICTVLVEKAPQLVPYTLTLEEHLSVYFPEYGWDADYAYVAFTPTVDGLYSVSSSQSHCNLLADLLDPDSPDEAILASGRGYSSNFSINYHMSANKTYIFRITTVPGFSYNRELPVNLFAEKIDIPDSYLMTLDEQYDVTFIGNGESPGEVKYVSFVPEVSGFYRFDFLDEAERNFIIGIYDFDWNQYGLSGGGLRNYTGFLKGGLTYTVAVQCTWHPADTVTRKTCTVSVTYAGTPIHPGDTLPLEIENLDSEKVSYYWFAPETSGNYTLRTEVLEPADANITMWAGMHQDDGGYPNGFAETSKSNLQIRGYFESGKDYFCRVVITNNGKEPLSKAKINVSLTPYIENDTSSKPTNSQPANSKPTSSQPTTSKPTASQPTASNPTASKPAIISQPSAPEPTKSIVMRLNSTKALLNGADIAVDPSSKDVAPFTLFGKTMVPVRFVQQLGADVKYDSNDKPVIVSYGNIKLQLKFDNDIMKKTVGNAAPIDIKLPTAPTMVEGKTCVPIREVAEGLGFSVKYDSASFVIVASTKELSPTELAAKIKEGSGLNSVIEPVKGIDATPKSYSISVGGRAQIARTGVTLTPSNVGCNKLVYSTSNPSIATVTSNGLIIAQGKGTATITISSHNKQEVNVMVTVS